jgi:hypothetical protein
MARSVKSTWGPCVSCGDKMGKTPPRGKTPARFSLIRFGVDGSACLTCYNRYSQNDYRRRKRERAACNANLAGE